MNADSPIVSSNELPTDLEQCQKLLLHERKSNKKLQDTMQKQRELNEALLSDVFRLQGFAENELTTLRELHSEFKEETADVIKQQHETIVKLHTIRKRDYVVILILSLLLLLSSALYFVGCREQPTAISMPKDTWLPIRGSWVYDHFENNARTYRDTTVMKGGGTKRLRYGVDDWLCNVYSDGRLVYGVPIDTARSPRLIVALPDSIDAEFVVADTISTATQSISDKVVGYFQSLQGEPTQGIVVARETSLMTYYITLNVGLTRIDSAGVTVQSLWRYVK